MQETGFEKTEHPSCPVAGLLADCVSLSRKGLAPHLSKTLFKLSHVLENISRGKALPRDLADVASLGKYLEASRQAAAATLGRTIARVLSSERVSFETHIRDRICLTGDCECLSPAPCQWACPAGIDVAGYVALIGQGRDSDAISLIREANPFPWVCGLACTHPCETACVRRLIDTPVAIKALKAFSSKIVLEGEGFQNPVKAPDKGHKVCVVGAGPSGLTAAYFLSLKGYGVTVIESLPWAGGMMRVGIPRYRIPLGVLEREIDLIRELGVVFRFNTHLEKDMGVDALRQEGFEAFYVATGAHKGFPMGIKGETEFPQVLDAVTYLHRVGLDCAPDLGPRLTVVGGGNVALDAARTALRLGCSHVTVLYRRTRKEMPALAEDVSQAEAEGVRFLFLKIPVEIRGHKGRVCGISCLDARLAITDETGRQRPVPIPGSRHEFETDAVLHAIGQRPAREGLSAFNGMAWSERDTIVTDPLTGQTGAKGVFAGGDAVTGPATLIEAIAAGKTAAENIHRYLQKRPPLKTRRLTARRRQTPFLQTTASQKTALTRPLPGLLEMEKRKRTFEPVKLTLTPEAARAEALRCLRCDVCIQCGRCMDACREKLGFNALRLGYVNGENPGPTDFQLTAERCILCGACAAICPTGAMTMTHENGSCILRLCGMTLCRDTLDHCHGCGEALGAVRYVSYMEKQIEPYGGGPEAVHMCRACKQRMAAATKIRSTKSESLNNIK